MNPRKNRQHTKGREQWKEFASGCGNDIALGSGPFHHRGLLASYARVYHEASITLFRAYWNQDGVDDMKMLPIVFLYRHAVELYLKVIVDHKNDFVKTRKEVCNDLFAGHPLSTLLPDVKSWLEFARFSAWEPPINSFSDVERIVIALDGVPHDALRYPVSQNGEHLLPNPLVFNDADLAEKSEVLLNVLRAAEERLSSFEYLREPQRP